MRERERERRRRRRARGEGGAKRVPNGLRNQACCFQRPLSHTFPPRQKSTRKVKTGNTGSSVSLLLNYKQVQKHKNSMAKPAPGTKPLVQSQYTFNYNQRTAKARELCNQRCGKHAQVQPALRKLRNSCKRCSSPFRVAHYHPTLPYTTVMGWLPCHYCDGLATLSMTTRAASPYTP